jgi:hypothetical protein
MTRIKEYKRLRDAHAFWKTAVLFVDFVFFRIAELKTDRMRNA